MKWPRELVFVRHAQSEYNTRNDKNRIKSKAYREFEKQFFKEYNEMDIESVTSGVFPSAKLLDLTHQIIPETKSVVPDHQSEISEFGHEQARETGRNYLKYCEEAPTVVITSTHIRTKQTLQRMSETCPEIAKIEPLHDHRVREREHGHKTQFQDSKVFYVLNPEEAALRRLEGKYHYRFPGGENIPEVDERLYDFLNKLSRDYAGENVMVVSHHLTIETAISRMLKWTPEEFNMKVNKYKPDNCSLTTFAPNENGSLRLKDFNINPWKDTLKVD